MLLTIFNNPSFFLHSSLLFVKNYKLVFFFNRNISRRVRLKRRRFFSKFLYIKPGFINLTHWDLVIKRSTRFFFYSIYFNINKIKAIWYNVHRLSWFKAFGNFLFSFSKVVRFKIKFAWLAFFYRYKALRNILKNKKRKSLRIFATRHSDLLNLQLFYKKVFFSMPVISRKFINKRFLKKYKRLWIRKVKPWWRFYKNRRRILWLFKRQYRIRWNRKWFLGLQSRRFLSLRSNIQLLRLSRGGDQMKIFSIRRDFLVLDNFLFNLRHSLAFRNGSGKYLFFLRRRLRAVKRRTTWKRFVRSKNNDNKIRVKTRVFFNLFRSRRRQFSTGFSRFELFLGVLFMLLKKHWNYFIKQFYIWAYLRNFDYTWNIIKKADRRLAFRTRTNIIHFSSKKLYVPFFLRRKVSFVWSKTRNRFYKPLFSRVYFQKKLLYDRRIATARLKHSFAFVFFQKLHNRVYKKRKKLINNSVYATFYSVSRVRNKAVYGFLNFFLFKVFLKKKKEKKNVYFLKKWKKYKEKKYFFRKKKKYKNFRFRKKRYKSAYLFFKQRQQLRLNMKFPLFVPLTKNRLKLSSLHRVNTHVFRFFRRYMQNLRFFWFKNFQNVSVNLFIQLSLLTLPWLTTTNKARFAFSQNDGLVDRIFSFRKNDESFLGSSYSFELKEWAYGDIHLRLRRCWKFSDLKVNIKLFYFVLRHLKFFFRKFLQAYKKLLYLRLYFFSLYSKKSLMALTAQNAADIQKKVKYKTLYVERFYKNINFSSTKFHFFRTLIRTLSVIVFTAKSFIDIFSFRSNRVKVVKYVRRYALVLLKAYNYLTAFFFFNINFIINANKRKLLLLLTSLRERTFSYVLQKGFDVYKSTKNFSGLKCFLSLILHCKSTSFLRYKRRFKKARLKKKKHKFIKKVNYFRLVEKIQYRRKKLGFAAVSSLGAIKFLFFFVFYRLLKRLRFVRKLKRISVKNYGFCFVFNQWNVVKFRFTSNAHILHFINYQLFRYETIMFFSFDESDSRMFLHYFRDFVILRRYKRFIGKKRLFLLKRRYLKRINRTVKNFKTKAIVLKEFKLLFLSDKSKVLNKTIFFDKNFFLDVFILRFFLFATCSYDWNFMIFNFFINNRNFFILSKIPAFFIGSYLRIWFVGFDRCFACVFTLFFIYKVLNTLKIKTSVFGDGNVKRSFFLNKKFLLNNFKVTAFWRSLTNVFKVKLVFSQFKVSNFQKHIRLSRYTRLVAHKGMQFSFFLKIKRFSNFIIKLHLDKLRWSWTGRRFYFRGLRRPFRLRKKISRRLRLYRNSLRRKRLRQKGLYWNKLRKKGLRRNKLRKMVRFFLRRKKFVLLRVPARYNSFKRVNGVVSSLRAFNHKISLFYFLSLNSEKFIMPYVEFYSLYGLMRHYFSALHLFCCNIFFILYSFPMSWIFIFNFKLSKKEPFQIREQKKQRRNWLVLEQDIRVVKSGGWSKKKTGRKFVRRVHYNKKKLLPLARRYIFATRKKGYTVDITNILLYFYKYVYQRAFSKKKLKSFLRSNILSQADIIFSVDIFNVLRERLLGPVYNRWSFLVMNKVYRWLLKRNSFKFVSVERKKLWSVYNLKSVINSMNGVFYLRAYYFLFFRKIFRKLRKHLRRKRVRVSRYKHLYDPVFLSFYKKKKNPFFLFTLFKSKRWNICLENKTSRIFLRESKLKRPAYKTKQFKRVKIIRQLQSNRSGTRRRRSLFRVKKHVFKFLDQYLYANVKRFKYLAKRTNADFDFVAFSFYNNMSFLLYRLGVIGTLSASLSAVKCHWFCLDFELVTSFTSLVSIGSIITLYPSLFVFSAFVWYRNFFIRQSYKRAISNKHFIVAKQPFFVFVFCKKYKSLFIYNKFELIKPFVLKNLKMI